MNKVALMVADLVDSARRDGASLGRAEIAKLTAELIRLRAAVAAYRPFVVHLANADLSPGFCRTPIEVCHEARESLAEHDAGG